MRFTVVIALALLCTVLGVAFLNLSAPKPPQKVVETVEAEVPTAPVLVARGDIPAGTVITKDMLDQQPWPKHLVPEEFMVGDAAALGVIGAVTRADFHAHEPLLLSKLAKPGEGNYLASSLDEGMRAVTIAIDAVSGVAGHVLPGDRVDVVLASAIGEKNTRMATVSEVLFPDVKVLAVGERKAEVSSTAQAARPARPEAAPATVTLELSQEDAAKIKLAEKNGTLSLALRSAHDTATAKPLPILIHELSAKRAARLPRPSNEGVIIIRGVGKQADARPSPVLVAQ